MNSSYFFSSWKAGSWGFFDGDLDLLDGDGDLDRFFDGDFFFLDFLELDLFRDLELDPFFDGDFRVRRAQH